MKYFKETENGFIIAISKDYGKIEITENEYNKILSIIHTRPTPKEGFDYKLKDDLTWVEYEIIYDEEKESEESE